jgi:hypothetical protein
MIARMLMAASAAVILVLGMLHLAYTLRGPNLVPRDPALQQQMERGSLVLNGQINVWKAWIGFNASHSLGLILFGLIYGHLAWSKSDVLFHSPFLLVSGLGMLCGWLVLARLYWFSVPFWGVLLAVFCYLGSVGVSR